MICIPVESKKMWFEDLKNVNDEKMNDSLPISMNYFEKNDI